jgi:hypothetical protein
MNANLQHNSIQNLDSNNSLHRQAGHTDRVYPEWLFGEIEPIRSAKNAGVEQYKAQCRLCVHQRTRKLQVVKQKSLNKILDKNEDFFRQPFRINSSRMLSLQ